MKVAVAQFFDQNLVGPIISMDALLYNVEETFTKRTLYSDTQRLGDGVSKLSANMRTELEGAQFIVSNLVESVIPLSALPYDIDRMLKALQNKKTLYNRTRKEWKWPKKKGDKLIEDDVMNFLNKIARAIRNDLRRYGKESGSDCVFSTQFKDAGRNKVTEDRKPDLVVYERYEKQRGDRTDVRGWQDIRAVVSIKSTDKPKDDNSLAQIIEHSRICYSYQYDRRFALGVTIYNTQFSFHVIDRSGTLHSHRYDINQHPDMFLRAVIGLLFLDDSTIGYDTTFHKKINPDGSIIRYVTVQEEEYKIVKDVYVDRSIRGRGTVCLLVVDATGRHLVLKDSWVDTERTHKEEDMLSEIAGFPNVAKLVVQEIVKVRDVETGEEVEDSTEHVRRRVGLTRTQGDAVENVQEQESNEATSSGAPAQRSSGGTRNVIRSLDSRGRSKKEYKCPEVRKHHRILIEPYGFPLEKFRSLKELVGAVKDVIMTIVDLKKKKNIIHRDVSIGNIILAERMGKLVESEMEEDTGEAQDEYDLSEDSEEEEFSDDEHSSNECEEWGAGNTRAELSKAHSVAGNRRRGVLIDFDYAIRANRKGTRAKGKRTGTLPFMAVEVLKNSYDHDYFHDIESVFYVLIWIVLTQVGPGQRAPAGSFDNTVLRKWCPLAVNNDELGNIGSLKFGTIMIMSDFREHVINRMNPYFKPLRGLLMGLRAILFKPRPAKRKKKPVRERKEHQKHISERDIDYVRKQLLRLFREVEAMLRDEYDEQPSAAEPQEAPETKLRHILRSPQPSARPETIMEEPAEEAEDNVILYSRDLRPRSPTEEALAMRKSRQSMQSASLASRTFAGESLGSTSSTSRKRSIDILEGSTQNVRSITDQADQQLMRSKRTRTSAG